MPLSPIYAASEVPFRWGNDPVIWLASRSETQDHVGLGHAWLTLGVYARYTDLREFTCANSVLRSVLLLFPGAKGYRPGRGQLAHLAGQQGQDAHRVLTLRQHLPQERQRLQRPPLGHGCHHGPDPLLTAGRRDGPHHVGGDRAVRAGHREIGQLALPPRTGRGRRADRPAPPPSGGQGRNRGWASPDGGSGCRLWTRDGACRFDARGPPALPARRRQLPLCCRRGATRSGDHRGPRPLGRGDRRQAAEPGDGLAQPAHRQLLPADLDGRGPHPAGDGIPVAQRGVYWSMFRREVPPEERAAHRPRHPWVRACRNRAGGGCGRRVRGATVVDGEPQRAEQGLREGMRARRRASACTAPR